MIGSATYPSATIGFSITTSIVLHLGHRYVSPVNPGSAMRTVTSHFFRGSLLYRMVHPQDGFAHLAIGYLSCVALRNRITSLYIFNNLKGDALYFNLTRLQFT